MRTWLIVDTHYLCHRAFHTTRDLSWKDRPTGVIFGLLKSIPYLKDDFQTDRIVFCFESPQSKRKELFPPYKQRRHNREMTDEEKEAYIGLKYQISKLQKEYLPFLGFKNVFSVSGYESDDIMAKIAAEAPPGDDIVLVTGDMDLLQCLRPGVLLYSPQKRIACTEEDFLLTYKIVPRKWALVKAIGGCSTDEVPGVPRVGERMALAFVRKELKPESVIYQRILSPEGKAIVRRNRALVELPFPGLPDFELQEDEVSLKAWKELCAELGMKSIAGMPPIASRKLMTYGKRK